MLFIVIALMGAPAPDNTISRVCSSADVEARRLCGAWKMGLMEGATLATEGARKHEICLPATYSGDDMATALREYQLRHVAAAQSDFTMLYEALREKWPCSTAGE